MILQPLGCKLNTEDTLINLAIMVKFTAYEGLLYMLISDNMIRHHMLTLHSGKNFHVRETCFWLVWQFRLQRLNIVVSRESLHVIILSRFWSRNLRCKGQRVLTCSKVFVWHFGGCIYKMNVCHEIEWYYHAKSKK